MRANLALSTVLATALAATFAGPGLCVDLDDTSGNYGAHVGYAKTQDADEGNVQVGGHLEFQLAPWLGVQGAADYRSAETVALSSVHAVDMKTVPITLSGRIYLPSPRGFHPFASAGAGWYHQILDFSESLESLGVEDRSRTEFGWHAGAGARLAIAPRVSLFGEGRFVFLDPERDFGDDVEEEIENIDFDSTYLSGGLSVHF